MPLSAQLAAMILRHVFATGHDRREIYCVDEGLRRDLLAGAMRILGLVSVPWG
jgi:hypothetical protein